MNPSRRTFLASAAVSCASLPLLGTLKGCRTSSAAVATPPAAPLFDIGLAQWSLNTLFEDGSLDCRDFGVFARQALDLDVIEWVHTFFVGKERDLTYLREMRRRAQDHGVRANVLMVGGQGVVGHPDPAVRQKTFENHQAWVAATRLLDAPIMRVFVPVTGKNPKDAQKWAADTFRQLTEFAQDFDVRIAVENHGGQSSDPAWLTGLVQQVNLPGAFGTLPDFGNFQIWRTDPKPDADTCYAGVKALMPHALGVSAKSYDFDAEGNHLRFDLTEMVRIVLQQGYRGPISIESEGTSHDKRTCARLTRDALQRARRQLHAEFA